MNNTTCETCQRKQGTTNVALDEFYLKNHLGSTVAVMDNGAVSTLKAAYDYRAFGEQVDLEQKGDKVTENFTGKCPQGECSENTLVYFHCRAAGHSALRQEKDDETALNYFGARYLDPMLGLWISVDAARQYQNPYLYAGNNPIMRTDPDGNQDATALGWNIFVREQEANFRGAASKLVDKSEEYGNKALEFAKDEGVDIGVDIALVTLAVIQPELAPLCADALLVKGVAQGIMNDSPGQVLTSTVGFFIPGVNSVGKALGIYAVEKIVNETVVNPFLDEDFETKNIDMQKNYNDYAE
ncbi:RHS repeat domain-containing protein [Fibrobacter sp. UWEL]|uniref:RHS repeat domain-containing protein n=1 Tax=Fibrobacter sp. UWEL TaxID=1896209 RepID=UPI000919D21D|nr:RHS repeat-associated core domain-containing protein [Fibrobacter sp. UWEL]SHL41718.1 RHS repeat-associated core domain-containing protein [Fibrobacter sp. UWEL]